MTSTIALDVTQQSVKQKVAYRKSELRQHSEQYAPHGVQAFDWAEAELDVQYLKALTSLAELVADFARSRAYNSRTGTNGESELNRSLEEARLSIDALAELLARQHGMCEEADLAVQRTASLLAEATEEVIHRTESSGGATAVMREGTRADLRLLCSDSAAAIRSAACTQLKGADPMNGSQEDRKDRETTVIATVYGPVGAIVQVPGEYPVLKLQRQWGEIAEQINAAIEKEEAFIGPDRVARSITMLPSKAELDTLEMVLSQLSEGDLHLVPEEGLIHDELNTA